MTTPIKRTAFFISDGTGITAEALGVSLLSRFNDIDFHKETLPYIDSVTKANEVVQKINDASQRDGARPIIFDTIVNDEIREIISKSDSFNIDVFEEFLKPLEKELCMPSTAQVGRTLITENQNYEARIDAVNFALDNDDGAKTQRYHEADVILVGVSRSGKTPACLYLALQYGIKAANYPITEEDLDETRLPKALREHKSKVFGLTIEPERLALIRNERKPNSRYSSTKQCNFEVEEVEIIFRRERIPYLNTTHYSVEEISTRIVVKAGLQRRF